LELNYDINAYNHFTTSLSYGNRNGKNSGFTDALFTDPQPKFAPGIYPESIHKQRQWRIRYGHMEYSRTFKKPDQELSFEVQVGNDKETVDNLLSQQGNDPTLARNESNGNQNRNLETYLKLDYTHPFGEAVNSRRASKAPSASINSDLITAILMLAPKLSSLDELRYRSF